MICAAKLETPIKEHENVCTKCFDIQLREPCVWCGVKEGELCAHAYIG